MSYFLCKTRLNTHFNQIQKHFKTPDLLNNWLSACSFDANLIVKSPFEDHYQMTANAAYVVKSPLKEYNLAVKVVQSTQHTTYCFDVFIMLSPQDKSPQFNALTKALSDGLSNLRFKYNGDWNITDDDLTMSIFR